MPTSDWLGQHKASGKCTVVPVGWETLPWSIDRSIADEWVAKSIMDGCIFTSKPAPRCCRCWSTCRRCGRSRPDGCRRRTASRPQEWSLLQRRKKERESNKISRKQRSLKPKGHRRKVEKCKGAGGAGCKSHRLLAHLLGKVILTCVELKTDELLYLFLARHSYSPESVVLVLKMISSDRFLRKGKIDRERGQWWNRIVGLIMRSYWNDHGMRSCWTLTSDALGRTWWRSGWSAACLWTRPPSAVADHRPCIPAAPACPRRASRSVWWSGSLAGYLTGGKRKEKKKEKIDLIFIYNALLIMPVKTALSYPQSVPAPSHPMERSRTCTTRLGHCVGQNLYLCNCIRWLIALLTNKHSRSLGVHFAHCSILRVRK